LRTLLILTLCLTPQLASAQLTEALEPITQICWLYTPGATDTFVRDTVRGRKEWCSAKSGSPTDSFFAEPANRRKAGVVYAIVAFDDAGQLPRNTIRLIRAEDTLTSVSGLQLKPDAEVSALHVRWRFEPVRPGTYWLEAQAYNRRPQRRLLHVQPGDAWQIFLSLEREK
jgi:hypothetical protein